MPCYGTSNRSGWDTRFARDDVITRRTYFRSPLHDRDLFSGQIEIPDLSGLLMALIYRNFTFQFLDKPW